jgi:5-methyltetrahydropteroyltriglutamate--homocysteine methyltransferase
VILASLLNSYPRIGDRPPEQVLRRAIAGHDRGEVASSAVSEAEDEVTRQAITEQIVAGLDVLTDGQVRWHDPVSHVARGLAGFRIGGLLRYFDTNTYYRQPEIVGAIGREKPILAEAHRFASEVAGRRQVKAILTGPLTIARLSRDRRGGDLRTRVLEIASALNRELLDLEAAGAPLVQIDEPAVVRWPGDLPILLEAIPRMIAGLQRSRTILATSFGDATPLLPGLAALPVSILGFDLLAARSDVTTIARAVPPGRGLLLGILDGRNTRLEDPAGTFDRYLRPLLDPALGPAGAREREIHLAPNHGLEYLPRDVARAKMSLLATLRDRAGEALSQGAST